MLRFLQSRLGEMTALALCLAIAVFLYRTFDAKKRILENEQRARRVVETVYQLEASAYDELSLYRSLSELLEKSAVLADLEPLSSSGSGKAKGSITSPRGTEFFRDDSHCYLFQLVFADPRLRERIEGMTTSKRLTGFRFMAWPRRFAFTGELAFFVDARGRIAVSTNELGEFDGFERQPDDEALRTAETCLDDDITVEPNAYWQADRRL